MKRYKDAPKQCSDNRCNCSGIFVECAKLWRTALCEWPTFDHFSVTSNDIGTSYAMSHTHAILRLKCVEK